MPSFDKYLVGCVGLIAGWRHDLTVFDELTETETRRNPTNNTRKVNQGRSVSWMPTKSACPSDHSEMAVRIAAAATASTSVALSLFWSSRARALLGVWYARVPPCLRASVPPCVASCTNRYLHWYQWLHFQAHQLFSGPHRTLQKQLGYRNISVCTVILNAISRSSRRG